MKELFPKTTGGIWSILLGVAFAITGLAGAWGVNQLSAEQSWFWVGASVTLLLGHQARRAVEERRETSG